MSLRQALKRIRMEEEAAAAAAELAARPPPAPQPKKRKRAAPKKAKAKAKAKAKPKPRARAKAKPKAKAKAKAKPRKRPAKKRRVVATEDSSEEESESEEEYDSSSSESEEGESSEDEEFKADQYGPDLFGDAEDRARLMAMAQVEREEILDARGEDRQERLENHLFRMKLKERERQEKRARRAAKRKKGKGKKLKRAAQVPRERSSRGAALRGKERLAGLAEMRKQRREEQQDAAKLAADRAAGIGVSDSESDAEEDAEEDSSDAQSVSPAARRGAAGRSRDAADAADATAARLRLNQINTVLMNNSRVTRDILITLCEQPYFSTALPGMYVRVAIGKKPDADDMVYRVCTIVGAPTTEMFYLASGSQRTKPIKTKQALRVRCGRAERDIRMMLVSNGRFTDAEVALWKEQIVETGEAQGLTADRIRTRLLRFKNDVKNHQFTDVRWMRTGCVRARVDASLLRSLAPSRTRAPPSTLHALLLPLHLCESCSPFDSLPRYISVTYLTRAPQDDVEAMVQRRAGRSLNERTVNIATARAETKEALLHAQQKGDVEGELRFKRKVRWFRASARTRTRAIESPHPTHATSP